MGSTGTEQFQRFNKASRQTLLLADNTAAPPACGVARPFDPVPLTKYHVFKYEPIVNHPMLHHGVGYSCPPSDVPKVEALPNLGPYDRLKQGVCCVSSSSCCDYGSGKMGSNSGGGSADY